MCLKCFFSLLVIFVYNKSNFSCFLSIAWFMCTQNPVRLFYSFCFSNNVFDLSSSSNQQSISTDHRYFQKPLLSCVYYVCLYLSICILNLFLYVNPYDEISYFLKITLYYYPSQTISTLPSPTTPLNPQSTQLSTNPTTTT